MENKLIIIDGNSIAYRAFYGLPLLKNKQGEYTNAMFGFLNMMIKAIKELSPTHMAVVFDYPLKQNFRTELYADYKATRKPMPPELSEQMPKLNELIKSLGITIFQQKNVEADDVVGTLAKKFNEQTVIITGDRDALQLIDETTSVLLTKKGLSETKLLTSKNFFDEYGFDPINIVDLKSIMGDASDNIPGVKGIGEKGANELIKQYKTLESVYEHISELTPRLQKLLNEQKDIAKLSKVLATINTSVEIGEIDFESLKLTLPFNENTKQLFKKYEFNSLLNNNKLFNVATSEVSKPLQPNNVNKIKVNTNLVNTLELKTLNEVKNFVKNFSQQYLSVVLTNAEILLASNNKQQYKICFKQNLLDDNLNIVDVLLELKPILENDSIKKVCFNYKSLKHTLKEYKINLCGIYDDAKIGEWLISSNIKEQDINNLFLSYGVLNVSACGLFDICKQIEIKQNELGLRHLYKNIELPLIDCLYGMEENGIKIDDNVRCNVKADFENKTIELQKQIFALSGELFNLQSPKQVGEILFNKLNLGDIKWGTSIQVLKQIANKHPVVPLIIEYRKYIKLLSTYIIPFEQANNSKNIIHTTFNQTGTITGRLSSSNPNMQNIPARTGEGREVRKMFVSRFDGGELVSADYSQIELRLLAHYSGDPTLVDCYKNGEDVHALTASQIFGVPLNKVTKEQRKNAKAVNFGIIYGISAFGLSEQTGVLPNDAKIFIDNYYEHFASVGNYMNEIVNIAIENNGFVETLLGRKRKISELFATNKIIQKAGERAARNFPFQGSASDIIKVAMINISAKMKELKLKSLLCLQVHDELVFDCVKDEVDVVKKLAKSEMENVIKLSVPLVVDVDSGASLFEV